MCDKDIDTWHIDLDSKTSTLMIISGVRHILGQETIARGENRMAREHSRALLHTEEDLLGIAHGWLVHKVI